MEKVIEEYLGYIKKCVENMEDKETEDCDNTSLKEVLSSLDLVGLIVEVENYYGILLNNLEFDNFTIQYLSNEIIKCKEEKKKYEEKMFQIKKKIFE